MFLTESPSPLLTRRLLEDLGPLRVHRVFGVIRRLIDSSLLDDRILSLYHLRDDFECVHINCVYDVVTGLTFHQDYRFLSLQRHLKVFFVWVNLHTGFTADWTAFTTCSTIRAALHWIGVNNLPCLFGDLKIG